MVRLCVTLPALCTVSEPPASTLIIAGEIENSLSVTSTPFAACTWLVASLLLCSAAAATASAEKARTTVIIVNTIVAAPNPRSSGFLLLARTASLQVVTTVTRQNRS